jgi:hypothetical protein
MPNGKNGSTVYNDLASAAYALGYIFGIEMATLSIYMFVSIAGIIGNAFCVFIFYRPAFYSPSSPSLFAYMRYESLTGIVGNAIGTIFGLNTCAAILPTFNAYAAQWIQSYIATGIYTTAYYAKFLIEIAIVVDRILILVPPASRGGLSNLLKIKRPCLVFIGIWLFSAFVNLPYFSFIPASPVNNTLINYGNSNGYQVFSIFTGGRTTWSAWGNPGYFIMIAIYVFKNGLTFFVETALNIGSLVLFQGYLAQKQRLTSVLVTRRQMSHLNGHNSNFVSSIRVRENSDVLEAESPGGRNMANLVLFMTITGFVHNTLLTTFTVYNLIDPRPSLPLKLFQFVNVFASAVRHATNFLQFYLFNSNFRKEARTVLASFGLTAKVAASRTAANPNSVIHRQ